MQAACKSRISAFCGPITIFFLNISQFTARQYIDGEFGIELPAVKKISGIQHTFQASPGVCGHLIKLFTEPDLPRPYEVPGGKFGISLAIVACGTIIGLLVIPFSPASLNMVEWSIVIGWLAVGLALMAFTNSRKK